jgi:phosphoglycerate dehydrogenase-like enzyme
MLTSNHSLPAVALACLLLLTNSAFAALPESLQDLGLRESAQPVRELPGWEKPDKVVVRILFGQDSTPALRAMLPGVEVVGVRTLAEARAQSVDAQVLIGFCDQSIFDGAAELQWVQVFFAGVEDCVGLPAMETGKLLLTNGQRLGSPTLADHAIALMMSLSRGLAPSIRSQQQGKWQPNWAEAPPAFGELSGRTMLVVGLGGIGTQVAKRAHGLGMRVIATRGSRREGPDYVDYVGLSDETLELARQADVVVNAAPLTSATRGMFNAEFFAAMKPQAYFVSVGRGQSTVTDDLIKALHSGQIAGAGLDVVDPEPLPDGHPLWSAPGVIITPHVGGRSREAMQRVGALVAENLRRYVAGEPMLSVVDIKRGY